MTDGINGWPANEFYSPDECAALLGVGRASVYNALRRGEIPSVRVGKLFRIKKDTFDRFLVDKTVSEPTRAEAKVNVAASVSPSIYQKLVHSAGLNKTSISKEIETRLGQSFTEVQP